MKYKTGNQLQGLDMISTKQISEEYKNFINLKNNIRRNSPMDSIN